MINCIFLDLDQCLIYGAFPTETIPMKEDFIVDLESGEMYFAFVRNGAKEVIEFSRQLVGEENVFILTNSRREYALRMNKEADFGFSPKNIIARENYCKPTMAGYCAVHPTHEKYSKKNVLIDDYDFEMNPVKNNFIGRIESKNYFKCKAFKGINCKKDNFAEKVIDFLKEKHIT